MIYDCFTFNDELTVLEARLKLLTSTVDRFVIVEADRTFQGNSKAMVFHDHRHHFSQFEPKIIYVPVIDCPDTDAWLREAHQRNAILRGLEDASPMDVILITDVDEIPRPSAISQLHPDDGPVALEMFWHNFSVNLVRRRKWLHAKAVYRKDLQEPDALRRLPGLEVVEDAGWHVSFLGDVEDTRRKLMSFSHTELANKHFTSPVHISRCINWGVDQIGRGLFYVLADDQCVPTLSRRDHPGLYHAGRTRLGTVKAFGYALASRARGRIPLLISDRFPLLGFAIGLFLWPIDAIRRVRGRVVRWRSSRSASSE